LLSHGVSFDFLMGEEGLESPQSVLSVVGSGALLGAFGKPVFDL